jgi:trypsin-like peptidase
VRAVFVDPGTLAGAAKLPRSARALIAERELVRIVHPELPEPAVQAMPLPSTRQLRRLVVRPYRPGAPEPGAVPGSAAVLGALISEYLATQPRWRGGLLDIVELLGVDVDAVNAAIDGHPHLAHYTSVLAGPAEAGFRPTLRDGRLVVGLPSARGAELFIVGRHVEPDRAQGLDALASAVIRLRDVRLMHRADEPAAWQGLPSFQLIATAWQNAGAPVVDAGDLRVYRGHVAGHGLTLVTWRGELINYHPTAMATAALPASDRIAEALAAVVRVTGELTDAAMTAVATGVVVAPETVLSVAHTVVGVDPASLRVDGLFVSRIETLRATEFGVHAELAAQSVARTGAAGVPVYDDMVDLVLFTVPGLNRPAARLRATPVPVGTSLTAAGHPVDRWTQNHGPVSESGVHIVAAMALPHGFSGGPGLDADGAVAGIQSYGSASGPANFLGPELIAAFLETLRPGLGGGVAERP